MLVRDFVLADTALLVAVSGGGRQLNFRLRALLAQKWTVGFRQRTALSGGTENVDALLSDIAKWNLKRYETWLRGHDLNVRPSGYEPDELPGCSTPR